MFMGIHTGPSPTQSASRVGNYLLFSDHASYLPLSGSSALWGSLGGDITTEIKYIFIFFESNRIEEG